MKMRTEAHIIDVTLNSDLERNTCHCIMCNKYVVLEVLR